MGIGSYHIQSEALERSWPETGHFALLCTIKKLVLKVQMEVCTPPLRSVSPSAYETKGYLTLRGGRSLPPTTTAVSPSPGEAENMEARFLALLAHGPWESVTHPSLSTGSAYG